MEATSAPRPHALRIPRPRRLLAALSDERLVEHVRQGEAVAFEVLYDRYSSGILGFCRHMLGSVADAEDAVQHTFIAAHADIQRHDRRDLHVKAWLYTIARNRCLSMLRARREQPHADPADVVTENLVHDIQQREDLRELLADVAKLPDEQREALVLAEVGDLSHSDIAAILDCEASKVKSLVFQARTALIDRRTARETPCAEIREQLATLRGGALRRSRLRHHLEACPGCTQYREEVRRQRAMLALALPVLPSAALRANVLHALGAGGGSAAAGGAAVAATGGGLGLAAPGGVAAKLGIVAILAVGGAGGATVARSGNLPFFGDSSPAPKSSTPHPGATAATSAAHTASPNATGRAHKTDGSRRSASGSEHGFTPVTGESNGARAREFAATRGKGKQTSAAHRHATAHKRAHPAKPLHVKHVAAPRKVTPTAPTHTAPAPAPKSEAPAKSTEPAPATTTTEPAPQTTTQQAPAPPAGGKGISDGTTGKTLGSGTSVATTG